MNVNFTPGPSQLFYTVADHAKVAFKEGIPSISHRSKKFESIFQKATDGLKELLGVPADYAIFFTSSATEIWEKSIQNLVETSSVHFVNGAFSNRYFEIAIQLGKKAVKIEDALGHDFSSISIENYPSELIALTQNETSTGVSITNAFIQEVRSKNPQAILAIDAVSSLPYPALDYSQVDTVFFCKLSALAIHFGFTIHTPKPAGKPNPFCTEKKTVST